MAPVQLVAVVPPTKPVSATYGAAPAPPASIETGPSTPAGGASAESITDLVSAGPVPEGTKVDDGVSTSLSNTMPLSRIHTLSVCRPTVGTSMVATTPSR